MLTLHFHFPDFFDSQIYDFQFRFVCKAGLHKAATGKRVVTALSDTEKTLHLGSYGVWGS